MPYAILAAALITLDQVVKFLVRTYIPQGGSVPFIPHIMELTYFQNTGCAFSLLEDHTWVLTIISAVLSVVLAVAVARGFFRHPLGRTALTVVLAGAVGNLIDRALLGYVVDMFRTTFINFAVFNVADVCVVVGGFAAAAYYLFLYEKLEGKGKAQDAHSDPQL